MIIYRDIETKLIKLMFDDEELEASLAQPPNTERLVRADYTQDTIYEAARLEADAAGAENWDIVFDDDEAATIATEGVTTAAVSPVKIKTNQKIPAKGDEVLEFFTANTKKGLDDPITLRDLMELYETIKEMERDVGK